MEWDTVERQKQTKEQNKKAWASSVGLCQRRKPQHPHHMKVSPRGLVGRSYGMKYGWKGHEDRNRLKNNEKARASSVGSCQRRKPQHPHHVKVSPQGRKPVRVERTADAQVMDLFPLLLKLSNVLCSFFQRSLSHMSLLRKGLISRLGVPEGIKCWGIWDNNSKHNTERRLLTMKLSRLPVGETEKNVKSSVSSWGSNNRLFITR